MRFLPSHVGAIAAKVAAESVRGEPPSPADLTDAGIRRCTDQANLDASSDDIAAIRAEFTARYGH